MQSWTVLKNRFAPVRSWLGRRWAPTAAAAAILATTLGVITDLDSLVSGGSLSQAEASALAVSVAAHLEGASVARGLDYDANTDLDEASAQLASSGDRRVATALTRLEEGQAERAFDDLETTAERLSRRHPNAAAQRYFAIAVLAESVDPERAERLYEASLALDGSNIRAIDRLGGVKQHLGQADAAQALFEQALELSRSTGNEEEEAYSLSSLGSLAWEGGDNETAEEYYRQSLELADLNGDLFWTARQLGNLALVASAQGDDEEAEGLYNRALELMEQVNDPVGIALAQNNLANIYRDRGELDRAQDLYRIAQAALEAAGQPQRAALTLTSLGMIAEVRAEFESAARFYERALERARDYRYLVAIERAARNAGWLAMRRGDYEAARGFADEALGAAAITPDPMGEADALILSLGISASEGDHARAVTEANQVLAIMEARDVPPDTRAYVHDALALSYYFSGDRLQAEAQAELALQFYEAANQPQQMAEQQIRLASLARDRNEADAACELLAEAEVNYGRSGYLAEANRLVERRRSEGCPERVIGGNTVTQPR